MSFQCEKETVRAFQAALEKADEDGIAAVLGAHLSEDHHFRGMYPFLELHGPQALAEGFWGPFCASMKHLQRRVDIFFAGDSDVAETPGHWVCSMGNFLGLFDVDFIGIPATGRIAYLRFAEFNRVLDGRIVETALFVDLLQLMHQAGVYPLGPSTGAMFPYPGPRTADGLLFGDTPTEQGKVTLDLVERMVADLGQLNLTDEQRVPPEFLARTWHDDMLWYGPYGIGATYTIPRYQEQHQFPFRFNLTDKAFIGHRARFAEGNYAAFFGWPNLSHRPTGGFMGLPAGNETTMRVTDVYRRDGDKLAENWVFIDIPWWLKQQGLDVFQRLRQLRRIEPL